MNKKYHTPYQRLMGHEIPEVVRNINLPDDYETMMRIQKNHPRIVAFELKYQNINWRKR